MCGRYTMLADELEILEEFGLEQEIRDYHPSYNVAPGQNVLAIIHDGKRKRAGYLRWGLVPSWAKDEKIGYKMINARSESAHEKPSFKNLMSRKRCLVIADSFYEWKRNEDGSKQPKRIHVANRKLFAFAGLWDKWSQHDKDLFTCTILTRDSNLFMKEIHHREPIILPKAMEDEWITPERLEPVEAREFLFQVEPEELTAYNVSSYVNAAKNNDESCIVPLAE
ncbi:SOS response-associated peptidase [Paucisalibacillus globulus]|uniref:SOS response-associated peptidase n=1 Tax=Paucisalibacillus globulus TaxID=351095 RepID=UPI000BB7497E|nr:SOS response-associated peptidase [Paucisalibacillus globulus]